MITVDHCPQPGSVQLLPTPATSACRARLTSTGALQRLDVDGLSMLLYPASELEAGLANIWLRRDGRAAALLGPRSGSVAISRPGGEALVAGESRGVRHRTRLVLADDAPCWLWQVELTADEDCSVQLLMGQDVALTPYDNVRINEYYVSQYLDLTPVATDAGIALGVRQNMPGEKVPWVLLGCLDGGAEWATDALQLVGQDGLDLDAPLPGRRLQHEHTLATIGSVPIELAAHTPRTVTFYGWLEADHPAPTSDDDARHLARVQEIAGALAPMDPTPDLPPAPAGSLFDRAPFAYEDLDGAALDEHFGAARDLVEEADGELLAFRCGDEHVTLAAKQDAVLRPHGQILRTGSALSPETQVLTSTIWMDGGFASQVTQGHVSRNRLLSTRRTYLGLQKAHGLRIFVDAGQGWQLLERPAAWALRPDRARWIHRAGEVLVEVTATAPDDAHRLEIELATRGVERAMFCWHSALGPDDGLQPASPGLRIDGDTVMVGEEGRSFTLEHSVPVTVGRDELLFDDATSRGLPWVCVTVEDPAEVRVTVTADSVPAGDVVEAAEQQPGLWKALAEQLSLRLDGGKLQEAVAQLEAILPFFEHDALVHHLSPRGLEQYTGGGWGTRDVCQGPVGLLTALDRPDAVRTTLLSVFRAQNERGDWPQAFEFLPPLASYGQQESHGDVVYWPLLALGEHLLRVADGSLLDEELPMVGDQGRTPPVAIGEHVRRAVAHIESTVVDSLPLPAYGHGDWNDSLQPADPALARRMVSTWTSVLQAHTLGRLAAGLDAAAAAPELAERCRALAERTSEAVVEHLVADEEMAGYGVVADDGTLSLLVHPRDERTGLTHGVLPWIHAISSDLMPPGMAAHHLELIRTHLLGPDGVRLFDRPAAYRGGPMEVFQRAEAATFWGREIGLMYTHAHLRYSEALARFGDAGSLFEMMMLAHPMGLTGRLEQAAPRQSTCYYSSSDARFADRYEAAEGYADLMAGRVALEGGWRVYSSGPGLWLRILVENMLGIRVRGARVEIDPVLDPRLDGLRVTVPVDGRILAITYRVGGAGVGVAGVTCAGSVVATTQLQNPYRAAGVSVALADLADELVVEVGA